MLCANDTNTDALAYKTTLTHGRLVRRRHQDKHIKKHIYAMKTNKISNLIRFKRNVDSLFHL